MPGTNRRVLKSLVSAATTIAGELKQFISDEKLTWINLHERDGKHPAMDEYGINGFPTTILIDKDGNVSGLNVNQEDLEEQLEELFGAPDKVKDADFEIPLPPPPAKDTLEKDKPRPEKKPKSEKKPKLNDDEGEETPAESLKKKYSF